MPQRKWMPDPRAALANALHSAKRKRALADTRAAPGPIATWVLGAALLFGCGGPFLVVPGGQLAGTEVAAPVADWSFVDDMFVDLETRPSDPYSVELNYILREGELFIDPSEGKRWLEHIREDPRVRVRFGDQIYRATAVLVGKPGELADFDPDRFIYRLEPR